MAQPAQIGPYIANEQLEQRRRELRAERFAPLAQSVAEGAFNLSQTMFALDEYQRSRAREKLEGLTMLGTFYDWDKLPPRAVNEWGAAFEQAKGIKVPRDTEGNVIPPGNTEERTKREIFASMTPEEKKRALFPKAFGDPLKAQEFAWKQGIDLKKIQIAQTNAAANWARATRAKDSELPSGYKPDANGYPVQALPGEPQWTNGQLKNAEVVKNFNMKQELDKVKLEAGRRALAQVNPAIKGYIKTMLSSKDIGIKKVGWARLDEAIQLEGGEPLGDMPPPQGFQAFVDQIFSPTSAPVTPKTMRKDIKESVEKLRQQRVDAYMAGHYDEARDIDKQIKDLQKSQLPAANAPQGPSGSAIITGAPVRVE